MQKFISFMILLLGMNLYSQDPVFTQFYNIPESLNPGFAGASYGTELGVLNRTQWPGLDYSLNSQFFYFDNYIDRYNSGIMLTVLNQLETETRYNFTQINLNYSYHVQLNYEWFFYPAISVGVGNKNFAFDNLLFGDQIIINKGIINVNSGDPILLNNNRKFLDLGAGFLLFNERMWFGASVKHINNPNTSLAGDGVNKLRKFLSVHGGYKLPLNARYSNSDYNLYFDFNFMRQGGKGGYDRFDIGSRYQINEFIVGAFATLAPTSITDKSHKLTSINFITNFDYKQFSFGSSYDLNLSSLMNTKGVFELSVSYKFDSLFGNNIVPCGCK